MNAAIPASPSVRATLQPADALAEDDEIVLDLHPLRRHPVATDSKCPAALLAAIRAHPALAVAKENAPDVEAALDCGAHRAASGAATLRVLADRLPTRPRGAVQWSPSVPESQRIRLDPELMRVAARLRARQGDDVLLAVGDEPLIIGRAGPAKILETSLDFESEERARRPEIPLLANLMFERLLDDDLLDRIAIADRGAGSAVVAPVARAGAVAASGRPSASARASQRGTTASRSRPARAAVGNNRARAAMARLERLCSRTTGPALPLRLARGVLGRATRWWT